MARFPRNYVFKLQLADALTHRSLSAPDSPAADQQEVLKIFDSLVSKRDENTPTIFFRYGESLLLLGNFVGAGKQFEEVVNNSNAQPRLRMLAELRLAQSLDLLGKRNEALSQYRTVLKSATNKQLQDEARHGLREPYRQ
jgi:hypothetical protein